MTGSLFCSGLCIKAVLLATSIITVATFPNARCFHRSPAHEERFWKRRHMIKMGRKLFYILNVRSSTCGKDCWTSLRLNLLKANCDSIYVFKKIRMVRARCYSRALPILGRHPKVLNIQRDMPVFLAAVPTSDTATFFDFQNLQLAEASLRRNTKYWWGHDRIDQRYLPLDHRQFTTTNYPSKGNGTRVFIIDTGCSPSHEQLAGRVDVLAAPGSGYSSGFDDHSHGTHIASTIVGKTIGIAPESRVTCIKALSSSSDGLSSDIIASINSVVRYKLVHPHIPVILSLSLGIRAPAKHEYLDNAINRAAAAGVIPVVAAGNDGGDACQWTPGRAKYAITVASIGEDDALARFSNRGPCVDFVAPGVSILAAHIKSDKTFARASGTSMAVPHAVGLVALMLGEGKGGNVEQVKKWMIDGAPYAQSYPLVYVDERSADKKNR